MQAQPIHQIVRWLRHVGAGSELRVDLGELRTALHAGVGYAIREVGGPALGTPFQYSAP